MSNPRFSTGHVYDQFGCAKYLVYFVRNDDPERKKHFMSRSWTTEARAAGAAMDLERVLNG